VNVADRDRLREFAEALGEESTSFYYENRYTHASGSAYVAGYSDALEKVSERLAKFAQEVAP
jgi:7-keto-8-aminopelargonate synthetase-like enzyme